MITLLLTIAIAATDVKQQACTSGNCGPVQTVAVEAKATNSRLVVRARTPLFPRLQRLRARWR